MENKVSIPKINFKEILSGLVFTLFINVILFILLALLITFTNFTDKYLQIIVAVVTFISIAIGALKSTKYVEKNGWLHGLIIGALYGLIIFLIGIGVVPGYSFNFAMLQKIILYVLIGTLSGMLGMNLK